LASTKSKQILSAKLVDELRDRYGRRSFPIRKGDGVVVTKGDYKGVEGTVMRIDPKRAFVYVEGVTRESADGKQNLFPLRSSNLVIKKLKLDDKARQNKIGEGPAQEGGEGGR